MNWRRRNECPFKKCMCGRILFFFLLNQCRSPVSRKFVMTMQSLVGAKNCEWLPLKLEQKGVMVTATPCHSLHWILLLTLYCVYVHHRLIFFCDSWEESSHEVQKIKIFVQLFFYNYTYQTKVVCKKIIYKKIFSRTFCCVSPNVNSWIMNLSTQFSSI